MNIPIGMQSTQQKHIVATEDSDRPLVTSGMHKLIPYEISDVFAIKAKDDGKVINIDEEAGLLLVEYKNGKQDLFDISPYMNKNSTGGFYTLQPMEVIVKEGKNFSKGDILAKNNKFFDGKDQGDISYNIGTLAKISLTQTDGTYEDSSMVTSTLSKRMATRINMKKVVTMGAKANLQYIVTEGQEVKTGDPLVIFENQFDDTSVNDLLDSIGDQFQEEIQDLTNKTVKSKYTGVITKIRVYYNNDINEYSNSLKKLINRLEKNSKVRSDAIKNNSKNLYNGLPINLDVSQIQKTDLGKINGEEFDGIMFEIFTEYNDELSVGDKISFNTALKTVVSDVFPKGEEPYSEFRPDEEISAFLSSLSVISRMTTDAFSLMLSNKALIELKRSIEEIIKE